MDIVGLANSLKRIDEELDYLSMDLMADTKEVEEKEKEKRKIMNDLLFYDEFKVVYEDSKEYGLDSNLLYPFKEEMGEFVVKGLEEFKEDVNKYLLDLNIAFKKGDIDISEYLELESKSKELANKQYKRIEKEKEKEKKEERIDIYAEYKSSLKEIEEKKKAFIYKDIGEESYVSLGYKYKNMSVIERKELLEKTHLWLAKEYGINSELDFTKQDYSDEKLIDSQGYGIRVKDIDTMPYPLDCIVLEQSYKLCIQKVLNDSRYSKEERYELSKMLVNDLSKQRNLLKEKIKKRELTPYGY